MGVAPSSPSSQARDLETTTNNDYGNDGDDLGVELLPIKWSDTISSALNEEESPTAPSEDNEADDELMLRQDGPVAGTSGVSLFHRYTQYNFRFLLKVILMLALIAATIFGTVVPRGRKTETNKEEEDEVHHDKCWNLIGSIKEVDTVRQKKSLSLSSDGTVVAVGMPHVGYNNRIGRVRVHQVRYEGNWIKGNDIETGANEDLFGHSVSLSSYGTIVAIGSPHSDGGSVGFRSGQVNVYAFDNEESRWIQRGNSINGEFQGEEVGWSVSLSSDGTTVAIGSPGYGCENGKHLNCGRVQVYELNDQGSEWNLKGRDTAITGDDAGDKCGYSISLSSNGLVVAVGAPYNDSTNGNDNGRVKVFAFDENGSWSQLGESIDGEGPGDSFGRSISLSADGFDLAVGAPYNDNINGENSGHVRVFELKDDDDNNTMRWIPKGDSGIAIIGRSALEKSGWSVSLSSDGSVVAIGSPYSNCGDKGHLLCGVVRIYMINNDGEWVQLGEDIVGDTRDILSGWTVSLSMDGSIVAIDRKGDPRVYRYGQCDT